MTVIEDTTTPGRESRSADPPPLDLPRIRTAVQQAVDEVDGSLPAAELIDRIADLESLQNTVAALQAATVRAFARAHAATGTASVTVQPEKLERSIAHQVGLACRTSDAEGRKRVAVARNLYDGLDHVRALFTAGVLSAFKVRTVAAATAHLDAAERAEVDRLLAEQDIGRRGVGQIRRRAQMAAAQVAPEKFLARCAAARRNRRVTLRPATDGMTDLIARLPVEQGVACYAALRKAVDAASVSPEPMTRSRGQIMADTLVERVTGQARAQDLGLAVQILVPLAALVDPGSPLPAEIPGHGPVPVDLLATAGGRLVWQRLLTWKGVVIGGDSTQRTFTGPLAELIRARDGHRCTEPYCDAPARQTDHVWRWAEGGPSEFTNGRAVCQLHNNLREQPGWRVDLTPDGIRTTTPTGHHYTAPGHGRRQDGTSPDTTVSA